MRKLKINTDQLYGNEFFDYIRNRSDFNWEKKYGLIHFGLNDVFYRSLDKKLLLTLK